MSKPSNIYAEKIFSEHPIALWGLDDSADFLSLISQNDKKLSGWQISGGVIEIGRQQGTDLPIESSPSVKVSNSNSTEILITSDSIINASDLNFLKNTMCFSLYASPDSSNVSSIELGYKYFDTDLQQFIEFSEEFQIASSNSWAFLSKSFEVLNVNSNIQLFIKINLISEDITSLYINGISFGQWTEQFHTQSTGVSMTKLSSMEDIALPDTVYAFPAKAYGMLDSNAYYLGSSNSLNCFNGGFPIVYGSSNLTKVIPSLDGSPSLVIPGFGFLNESGINKSQTLEFWMRVSPESYSERKIVGPISSTDGLYVDGPFLTLKIDNNISSHFIGSWSRPMLIDIRVSPTSASVLINGEVVITMSLIPSEISLATRTDERLSSLFYGKSQDWIGFYAYPDVPLLEIESVAIYSYHVSEILAKRRFVYGQGVEFPDNVNTAFGGESFFVDYQLSEYSNNYNYPDMGKWNQGVSENLLVNTGSLSAPEYPLPTIAFKNPISQSSWLAECSIQNDQSTDPKSFIDLSLLDSGGGYLLFDDLNILKQSLKAFYAVFKPDSTSEQVLFRVEDQITKSYFLVTIDGTNVLYTLYTPDKAPIVVSASSENTIGLSFTIGIDIDKFSKAYGQEVSTFFGGKNRLKLYVGGQPGFENGFTGKIYRVGLCTQSNLSKISESFKDDGTFINDLNVFADYETSAQEIYGGDYDTVVSDFLDGGFPDTFTLLKLYDHTASYTLSPMKYLGSFILDIQTESSWEDYVPLKYFGKYVNDPDGDKVYRLNSLQFNIDNPEILLDSGGYIDTSLASVRTYVSFQYLASGANKPLSSFVDVVPLNTSRVLVADSGWLSKVYEVVNGTVIYPPQNESFEKLAIVIHCSIKVDGIKTNPVKIKTIQIASQTQNMVEPTAINTKFGKKMFPYRKSGLYYDYSGINPVAIYKGTSPYLYLTADSGVELRELDSTATRGISVPVNREKTSTFKVGALQSLIRYSKKYFPLQPEILFSVKAYGSSIDFYIVASNAERTRGLVTAINPRTGLPKSGISLFLNGILVKDAFVSSQEWLMLGVQFLDALDFSNYGLGAIELGKNAVFNSISTYKLSSSQDAITSVYRTWSEVRSMLIELSIDPTLWGNFLSLVPAITWENVLYIPSIKRYSIDPQSIYESYTGTNKTIVSDTAVFSFKNYAYRFYNSISWDTKTITPV